MSGATVWRLGGTPEEPQLEELGDVSAHNSTVSRVTISHIKTLEVGDFGQWSCG